MSQCKTKIKEESIKGSVDSIETFGLVDGPGIRTVVFLNNCTLRCKFCHNPEMWNMKDANTSIEEIVRKATRSKPYYKNEGGVTFSGGEPLMQQEFVLETAKALKNEGINVALDTAGICYNLNKEIFDYIDLVLLDIKHITKDGYKNVTGFDYLNKFMEFVDSLNNTNIDVWIRQVIIPGVNDNEEYMKNLSKFIKYNIKNVKKVEFLPYHSMAKEKYTKLNIPYPYVNKKDMDQEKCNELYKIFINEYER